MSGAAAWLILKRLREEDDRILASRARSSYKPSSGFDSQLLAEAIADAKAVRATALANAKAALEDAFREHASDTDRGRVPQA